MSRRRLTVLAPVLSPPPCALTASHTLPFNYAQVWSYCIISLSLQYHPPVLHDGHRVRPVHQILLTRPSLLKKDHHPITS